MRQARARWSLFTFAFAALFALGLLSPRDAQALPDPAAPDSAEEKEAYARIALFYQDIEEEEARDRLYRKAADRFRKHLEAYSDGETKLHATFHLAECHYFLKDLEEELKES